VSDDGFGRIWGRNGKLCVTVGRGTRTEAILQTKSAKGPDFV